MRGALEIARTRHDRPPPWLLGMILVATACTLVAPTSPPEPTAVRDAESQPPACRNESLEVVAGQWGGATGQVVGFLVFRNRGAHACTLFGFPTLALASRDGRALVRATSAFQIARARTVVLPPVGPSVEYVPNVSPPAADGARPGQAMVQFVFGNLCVSLGAEIEGVLVTLPGELTPLLVPTRLPSPPRCDIADSSPSLAVGPFEPAPE